MNPNEKLFYQNDYIFKAGDLSQDIYLIKAGSVLLYQIHHGKEIEIAKMYPGDIFGEMAILGQSYRSATARVIEDALIHVIPYETVENTLKNNPIWINALIKLLTKRLVDMTQKYNEQVSAYHPFKYLNHVLQAKLSAGEKMEKITREFHEILLEKSYEDTIELIENIGDLHRGHHP